MLASLGRRPPPPFDLPLTVQRRAFFLSSRSLDQHRKPAPSPSSSSGRHHAHHHLPDPVIDYRSIAEDIPRRAHNASIRRAPIRSEEVAEIGELWRRKRDVEKGFAELHRKQGKVSEMLKRAGSGGKSGGQMRSILDGPMSVEAAKEEARKLKDESRELKVELDELEGRMRALASRLPNDTHPDVPVGGEEKARVVQVVDPHRRLDASSSLSPSSTSGVPEIAYNLSGSEDARLDHLSVASQLCHPSFPFNPIDMDAGTTVTGPSWPFLVGPLASLEFALAQYALHVAVSHGFVPVVPPDVVRFDVAQRCGFAPREADANQTYFVAAGGGERGGATLERGGERGLCLAGTAEIPLAGLFANRIFTSSTSSSSSAFSLSSGKPIKVVALGRAFRAEAGARGADTRGLYRVHQFSKVELFAVTRQEESNGVLEELRKVQSEVFEGLGLTFRVLDMPTEELGASAYRKYDIEAWMPGRGKWGEISSASNCTDYQSRRLSIRYRTHSPCSASSATSGTASSTLSPESSPARSSSALLYAHTLNGTAAAIPRLIVALLENGAELDERGILRHLRLPSVLRRWWIGAGVGDEGGRIVWEE